MERFEKTHLTPTARRKAQIHHRHAGPEQPVPIIDLQQLEGRPALEALHLGRPRELVAALPLSPAPRGSEPQPARPHRRAPG